MAWGNTNPRHVRPVFTNGSFHERELGEFKVGEVFSMMMTHGSKFWYVRSWPRASGLRSAAPGRRALRGPSSDSSLFSRNRDDELKVFILDLCL